MNKSQQNGDGISSDVSKHSGAGPLKLDEQNPWPGPAAYDESSHAFFRGRKQEASELLSLVRLAPLTVVYGKSGLGKTSLLQAGLYPLLRAEHYLPVHLRIDFSAGLKALPLKEVMRRLKEELDGVKAEYPKPGGDESLWEYLHRKDVEIWSKDNFPLIPVLVFDQFEELFSRSGGNPELIKQVFVDLANLIENRIPAEIGNEAGSSKRALLDLRSQRYRVVLSFREDFLPDMRAWEKMLPSLLRNCLRLEPMSRQRATEAVEQAGEAVLENDVASYIVDFIGKSDRPAEVASTHEMTIEPVLLSLCCYQLNLQRAPRTRVDKALVDKAGPHILDDYYQGALDDPDIKGPPDVALFIENNLIQGDRFRGNYPKEEALRNNFLTEKQLTALTDKHRLLRIVSDDTPRVELIHDRLVPVVRKARDERKARERQEVQERLAKEAQAERDVERTRSEELQYQRDKAKSIRNWAALTSVVSLILFFVTFYYGCKFLIEKRKTEQLRQRMELAVDTTRLAEGKLAFKAGSEPLEQTMYKGLAAYRLSEGFPEVRVSSLTALYAVLDAYGHLRKAVTIGDLMPTPALAYSPDGKTLAVGGEDGVIRLLETEKYHVTGKLDCGKSSGESVWTLSFNGDGTRLAAGYASYDNNGTGSGLLCVFDVLGRSKPKRWSAKEHGEKPGDVYSVAYGGKLGAEFVIAGGSDRMLRKWDLNTEVMSRIPHKEQVVGVAISVDGSKVVSGGDDAVIRVWSLADFGNRNSRPVVLRGHNATIQQVVFSPADPSILVSTGEDGRIIAWKLGGKDATNACLAQQSKLQLFKISNAAVSRDGLIAAASMDGNVRLFRLSETWVPCSKLASKQESSVTGLTEFDVIPEGVLPGHGGIVLGVAFNTDGDSLASTGQDGSIRIWGPATGGSLAELDWRTEFGGVTSLAISTDSTSIAVGDDNGNIHLWDRPEGNQPLTLLAAAKVNWKAHDNAIRSLAYIRVGSQSVLVSGGDDGVLKRWNTATQQAIGPDMEDQAESVRSLAVSPDGKLLAAGSNDGTVRFWDTATGARARSSIEKPKDVPEGYKLYAVSFSADGKYLAIGDSFFGLRAINLETPEPEHILEGHRDNVSSLFQGGEKWLLSAGWNGSVLEWTPKAVSQPQANGLKKHDGFEFSMKPWRAKPLYSMAATADGGLIVTGGSGGQVQLWDGIDRVLIAPRILGREEKSDILAVAMAPNGKFFVTADKGSRILVWPGPDRWADLICSKLSRNMSCKEWREWVSPEIDYIKQCPGLPIPLDEPDNAKEKP